MNTQTELIKIDVGKPKDRRRFLDFYYELMKPFANWVPPLHLLQNQIINPKKNPFLKETPHHFYLAMYLGKIVGRFALFGPGVGGADNGTFGFIDFEEKHGPEVLNLLKIESGRLGIKNLIGPLNPNLHYDVGVMVKGFDQPNYVMMNYNPHWYSAAFELEGFKALKSFNTLSLWKENYRPDERILKAVQRMQIQKKVIIRPANLRDFNKELRLFHRLYNQSFATHWGFQSISWDEFQFIAADLKYLLKPEMALIAEVYGEPIGFVLSIPNLNEIMASSRSGRLTPNLLGKLIFGLRKIRTVRVMILGVLPKNRFSGIYLALFQSIAENIFELGYKGGEVAWVMEGNQSVENTLRLMGAEREKEYLLFEKRL